MNDITEGFPPWLLPAVLVGVVLVAMFAGKSGASAGGSGYGAMIDYKPVPSDPGVIALAQGEVSARAHAFDSLVSLIGTETVSQFGAQRDVAIETLHARSADLRTTAQRDADLARTAAQEAVANHAADTTLSDHMASYDSSRTVSLADISARLEAQKAQSTASVAIAGTQENATKAVSKNNTVSSVVGTIGKVVGGALHFFGF